MAGYESSAFPPYILGTLSRIFCFYGFFIYLWYIIFVLKERWVCEAQVQFLLVNFQRRNSLHAVQILLSKDSEFAGFFNRKETKGFMKDRFTRDHHPSPGSAAHLNPFLNPSVLALSDSELCPCSISLFCEQEAVMFRS